MRPPAVLAKTAASIDRLSGGRFELGLGAGAFWDAIEAYGGQRRGGRESLEALDEAITVIRKVWSGERNLRFSGEHYQLEGAQAGPCRRTTSGSGSACTGLGHLNSRDESPVAGVPSFRGDLAKVADMTARLDESIAAAGRTDHPFRRVLNVSGSITAGASEGSFNGPAEQRVDELVEMAISYRFDTFIFWGDGDDQLNPFARQVAPAAREQLAISNRRAW